MTTGDRDVRRWMVDAVSQAKGLPTSTDWRQYDLWSVWAMLQPQSRASGEITVDSVPDAGTTFRVALPLAAADTSTATSADVVT